MCRGHGLVFLRLSGLHPAGCERVGPQVPRRKNQAESWEDEGRDPQK